MTGDLFVFLGEGELQHELLIVDRLQLDLLLQLPQPGLQGQHVVVIVPWTVSSSQQLVSLNND